METDAPAAPAGPSEAAPASADAAASSTPTSPSAAMHPKLKMRAASAAKVRSAAPAGRRPRCTVIHTASAPHIAPLAHVGFHTTLCALSTTGHYIHVLKLKHICFRQQALAYWAGIGYLEIYAAAPTTSQLAAFHTLPFSLRFPNPAALHIYVLYAECCALAAPHSPEEGAPACLCILHLMFDA